jgi:hypothetical protein
MVTGTPYFSEKEKTKEIIRKLSTNPEKPSLSLID